METKIKIGCMVVTRQRYGLNAGCVYQYGVFYELDTLLTDYLESHLSYVRESLAKIGVRILKDQAKFVVTLDQRLIND